MIHIFQALVFMFGLSAMISLAGCSDDDSNSDNPDVSAGTSDADMMPSECPPVAGESARDSAGDDTVDPAGDMAGDHTADPAGDIAGDIAGDMAGDDTVDPAGDMAGDVAGAPAGDDTVDPAGDMAGGDTVEPAGDMAGDMAGEELAPEINPEATSRYDGEYFATFERDGVKSALAQVVIQEGLIGGELINRSGERVPLGGFIDIEGVLRLPALIGDMDNTFSVIGRVTLKGSIEGTFNVSGVVEHQGTFAGSLNNQPVFPLCSAHDGLYHLSFVRGNSEEAVTTIQINQGRFSTTVVSAMGARFEARGFVSEDGTLSLLSTIPDYLFAEAYIDPDTRHIEGIYSASRGGEALVGDLRGEESD